jgi:hypothetical protein
MFFVVEFDSREVNQTVIKTPRVHITSYLFSYIYTNNAIFPIKVIILLIITFCHGLCTF